MVLLLRIIPHSTPKIQSVVTGQAPITLEWKNTLRKKYNKTVHIITHTYIQPLKQETRVTSAYTYTRYIGVHCQCCNRGDRMQREEKN